LRVPVIHNARDWRAVAFVAAGLLMLALPYAWRLPGWIAPPWIALATLLCFCASIINHNHMHRPIFRGGAPNRALNLALTLARGHSASGIVVPHNLNHHVHTNWDSDWIRPGLAGRGLGWARMGRYVLAASLSMAVERRRRGAPRLNGEAYPGLLAERIVLAGAIGAGLWLDWRVFALYNALPWLAGLGILVGVNLLQHDGCEGAAPLGESRNFSGAFGNWLLFNNGYHTAHHRDPGRHWSELPALHAQIRGRLPSADLEQVSILGYLWQFGWSRSVEPRGPGGAHG
jgi:fatty acid desaturase